MKHLRLEQIHLIGLQLPSKTTNENGQSGIDCGKLWQKFEDEHYMDRIPNKRTDDVIAAYHQYEGDYTQPFSYFVGCEVQPGTDVPEQMDQLVIPAQTYTRFFARGPMPDCMADTWSKIWKQENQLNRTYTIDFERYGPKSRDWSNAEVEIFIAVD